METVEIKSKVKQLCEFGQSVWLDNISRSIIDSRELKRLIDLGVTGVTSNPTIFDKSISGSSDYDDKIRDLKSRSLSTFQIYDDLTVADIQDAADLFRNVFEKTKSIDGYVSLEVNPLLAHKTDDTVKEAQRLYQKVNRPNVMLKIPATEDGFRAGAKLLSIGINVNFTLIFSLGQYMKAANAFVKGAIAFSQSGGNLENLSSVASVFVSRIDSIIDKLVDKKISSQKDSGSIDRLEKLKGKAAVANSQLIFAKYLEIFSAQPFLDLESKGLNKQRALWASTSTKDPVYSDIKYVAELIGRETINTIPAATLKAFLDHGSIENALTSNSSSASKIFESLKGFGIDINQICAKLLKNGVMAFEDSFNSLLKTIESKEARL